MSGRPPDPGDPEPPDLPQVLRAMDDARTLHEALGLVRALDHTSTKDAAASLQEVGLRTGHEATEVARELLHVVFPATHPSAAATGSGAALAEAVQRRWRWPLHELRRHDHRAGTRVWERVRAPGSTVASPRPRLN